VVAVRAVESLLAQWLADRGWCTRELLAYGCWLVWCGGLV
jgi:hypothetical protein